MCRYVQFLRMCENSLVSSVDFQEAQDRLISGVREATVEVTLVQRRDVTVSEELEEVLVILEDFAAFKVVA